MNLIRPNPIRRLLARRFLHHPHAQVLEERRQGHPERPGEFGRRGRAAREPLDHRPPGRVRQGLEHATQVRRLARHVPNYNGGDR